MGSGINCLERTSGRCQTTFKARRKVADKFTYLESLIENNANTGKYIIPVQVMYKLA